MYSSSKRDTQTYFAVPSGNCQAVHCEAASCKSVLIPGKTNTRLRISSCLSRWAYNVTQKQLQLTIATSQRLRP